MNLAQEVSSLETQLASVTTENDILKKHQGVLEFEVEQLRRALAKSNAERDTYLRRSEAIKVLLDQTGASLVNGITKYHDNERQRQEEILEVGKDDAPMFLSEAHKRLAETLTPVA